MLLLDVIVISLLFVIRAAAGAVAVDVQISPWLVVCTGLLAPVDQLVSIVAAATLGAYSIYTFTATESNAMMLTLPYVVFGLFRYLYLVHRSDRIEEPDHILLADRPILLTVALWTATAATILAFE